MCLPVCSHVLSLCPNPGSGSRQSDRPQPWEEALFLFQGALHCTALLKHFLLFHVCLKRRLIGVVQKSQVSSVMLSLFPARRGPSADNQCHLSPSEGLREANIYVYYPLPPLTKHKMIAFCTHSPDLAVFLLTISQSVFHIKT